ncbi:hypothetical protein GCM10027282_25400 [Frigoribacterium salinisoli]
MLASDVAQKRFRPTTWREGYDTAEVDAFLDEVRATLAAAEEGRAGPGVTPVVVVEKRFTPTRFRSGYDQDEVDDFLDEIVTALRRLEAR